MRGCLLWGRAGLGWVGCGVGLRGVAWVTTTTRTTVAVAIGLVLGWVWCGVVWGFVPRLPCLHEGPPLCQPTRLALMWKWPVVLVPSTATARKFGLDGWIGLAWLAFIWLGWLGFVGLVLCA